METSTGFGTAVSGPNFFISKLRDYVKTLEPKEISFEVFIRQKILRRSDQQWRKIWQKSGKKRRRWILEFRISTASIFSTEVLLKIYFIFVTMHKLIPSYILSFSIWRRKFQFKFYIKPLILKYRWYSNFFLSFHHSSSFLISANENKISRDNQKQD